LVVARTMAVVEDGKVLLYYCYEPIEDVATTVTRQREQLEKLQLLGRIRVASEGINGTLSGSSAALDAYCASLAAELKRDDIDWKWSPLVDGLHPFDGVLVQETRDLVGSEPGAPGYATDSTATHLSPEEFHNKVADQTPEKTAVIDVRNTYEYDVGHFEGAINPGTRKYSEFEDWFRNRGAELVRGKESVLMYCTGGIRCEKASIAVRKVLGEDCPPLFQLKGGIHRYLEAFDPQESKFKGRNFVFDKRVVQPMPREGPVEVVGRCQVCDAKWDTIVEERRCDKCRMLILVCDDCAANPDAKAWCTAHVYLDPKKSSIEMIQAKKDELSARLKTVQGRRNKSKRDRVMRQLEELEHVLPAVKSN